MTTGAHSSALEDIMRNIKLISVGSMALILGAAAFSAGCGDDSEGGGGTTASSTSATSGTTGTTGTGGAGGEGGSNEGGSKPARSA
ncbi:hypothetical protein BE20_36105 [Sorangium cellulosum]|nr:hypothetical protein BE20_36105 [Sorangium cellulosum]